eukprot:766311-Hanusia_phi.AAC.5
MGGELRPRFTLITSVPALLLLLLLLLPPPPSPPRSILLICLTPRAAAFLGCYTCRMERQWGLHLDLQLRLEHARARIARPVVEGLDWTICSDVLHRSSEDEGGEKRKRRRERGREDRKRRRVHLRHHLDLILHHNPCHSLLTVGRREAVANLTQGLVFFTRSSPPAVHPVVGVVTDCIEQELRRSDQWRRAWRDESARGQEVRRSDQWRRAWRDESARGQE